MDQLNLTTCPFGRFRVSDQYKGELVAFYETHLPPRFEVRFSFHPTNRCSRFSLAWGVRKEPDTINWRPDCIKRGSIRYKLLYWSRMIACCILHKSKIVFIERNTSFFWHLWWHLMKPQLSKIDGHGHILLVFYFILQDQIIIDQVTICHIQWSSDELFWWASPNSRFKSSNSENIHQKYFYSNLT